MRFNIKVLLVVPSTGYTHEGWLMADDTGTRMTFDANEATDFVKHTLTREEFKSVTVVPAQ
jgi:hypothetical protein